MLGITFGVLALAGWFFGEICACRARVKMKREAIDHGHAHYDPRDGSFTWNAPAECGQQQQERQAADE